MTTCEMHGILMLVYVLNVASCRPQDTNDVILTSDIGVNNPTTEGLITQIENVTVENATATYCKSFAAVDLSENLTWPREHVGRTVGVTLENSICGAKVFRDCLEGGNWSDIRMPQQCLIDKILRVLVLIGFGMSLMACVVAFAIFVVTRSSLRGLGHYQYQIHWNLITSFILYLTCLLVSIHVFQTAFIQENVWLRNLLTVLVAYFVSANFFWMLVEGLVLFVLVATAFPGSQRGRAFVKWCFIGWGIPGLLVISWVIVEKATTPPGSAFILQVGATEASNYAFLIGPIFAALVINGIVLVIVMRILWQKLRDDARNNIRSSRERSSWRAAKSTFVILILLGVYYALPILVFVFNPPFLLQYVISSISNIINSLQGLAVCMLYVFCNAEVREQVRRALKNVRRRLRNTSSVTYSTRLSSPSLSRSATPRHSKSHSSSEGSAGSKRPSTAGSYPVAAEEVEMAVAAEEPAALPRRQTCVVMEPLVEDPSECGRGELASADV